MLRRTQSAMAALVVMATAFAHASELDQEFIPDTGLSLVAVITDRVSHVQTFTMGVTGTIDIVHATFARNGGMDPDDLGDLIVELYRTENGVPIDFPIARVTIPTLDVRAATPGFGEPFTPVDFRPYDVRATEGEVIALVLPSPGSPDTGSGPYIWIGKQGNQYPGGAQGARFFEEPWMFDPDHDLGFRTFVTRQCAGDLDGDGAVGFSDLVALLAAWGGCP